MNKNKKQIINRLKITQGHLNKVLKMVSEDKYCIDILHQNKAVQSALKKIDELILENHLNTCVVDSIKKGRVKKVVDEILNVLKKTS